MQAKSNLAVFGLVLVFAFPFAGQRTFGAATTRGGSVGTVLRALFANYAAIKTVAFRAKLTAGPVASGKASWKPEIVARYTFFAKGISYRELYLVARPHTLRSLDCLTAFDGKRFEFLYLPSRSLSISKAPPAGDSNPDMPNPLVLPLMFLARQPKVRTYNFAADWANFRQHGGRLLRRILSKVRGGTARFQPGRGGRGAVLTVSYRSQLFKVRFLRSPDFLPRSIVLTFDGKNKAPVKYRFRYRKFGPPGGSLLYLPVGVAGVAGPLGAQPQVRSAYVSAYLSYR